MTTTDTTTAAPVKVGDFFECSWGYDQTNVDFYEVLSITPSGKSVKVRRVQTSTVSENGSSTHVAPLAGTVHPYHPEVMTKRLRPSSYHGWSFFVASYADAYLWDLKPAYETAQGWGH